MDAGQSIAWVAALIADRARARMLTALMDGRARTAKELAYGAGVTPQTASGHLAKLLGRGLLVMEQQGRHRYFRLAAPSVGHAIEAMMGLAPKRARESTDGPLDRLRLARTCYDHLAGRLGVKVADAMVRRRLLRPVGRDFILTAAGARLLERLGVDVAKSRRERRAFARQCLDWSERRAHLAGALGAALTRRCLDLRWVQPVAEERALAVTSRGRSGLRSWFGIQWRPGGP